MCTHTHTLTHAHTPFLPSCSFKHMGSKEGAAHTVDDFLPTNACRLQCFIWNKVVLLFASTWSPKFFTTEDEADCKLKKLKHGESEQEKKIAWRSAALRGLLDWAVAQKNWGIKVKCFGTGDEAFKREWLPSLAMLLFNWGLVEPTGPRCLRHLITTPRPFALHSGPAASAAVERCSLYSLPPRSLPGIWS